MKWSLKIARVAGIGIYVHWTFFLLIAWIVFIHLADSAGAVGTAESVGFVLAVFGCIVLHELGHALTARRFNVQTRDITLLPIGGVARLERMPKEPRQELLVALAGPAVNFVIAGILYGVIMTGGSISTISSIWSPGGPFLDRLMWINLVLAVFNLLPGFPMDGGRVLRALLGWWMDYERATDIAARVGQATAIMFAVVGYLFNWILLFIALFVYVGAHSEAHMVHIRSMVKGVPVREAMLRHVTVLSGKDTLGHAADDILGGSQQSFPVIEDGHPMGILPRDDLLMSIARHGRNKPVDEVKLRQCETVEDTESLDKTIERMLVGDCEMYPVVHDGQLVGVITMDNVGEWLETRAARQEAV
jgi:Zn-dependent protease